MFDVICFKKYFFLKEFTEPTKSLIKEIIIENFMKNKMLCHCDIHLYEY